MTNEMSSRDVQAGVPDGPQGLDGHHAVGGEDGGGPPAQGQEFTRSGVGCPFGEAGEP